MIKDDVDDPKFLKSSADYGIQLSAEATEQLEKIMDNPPPATDGLKKLMSE